MLRITRQLAVLPITALLLSGCATNGGFDPTINGSHAQGQAAVGAGLGAVLGAVIGNQTGDSRTGAVIGAAIGGAAGYMNGRAQDIQLAMETAARARQAGFVADVYAMDVPNAPAGQPKRQFKGYHVSIPVANIARKKPVAMQTIQDTGMLAERTNTVIAVSGPQKMRQPVIAALGLTPAQVQFVPSKGKNVEISLFPRRV